MSGAERERDARTGNGAARSQGPRFCICSTEPCACASKTSTWLSRRSRPCPSRPRSRTIRPSTPASTRSSLETRQAQPEPPARAWITAWLATALWGARFAKPLSTPTQPTPRSQKGDISTRPEKGTLLLCLDTLLVCGAGPADRDDGSRRRGNGVAELEGGAGAL